MLEVHVGPRLVGTLFKPESAPENFHFAYEPSCPPESAVSLSMPVVREHYASATQALHPVFDMNLPEGALAERLRRTFSKLVPDFDALAMLKIVGQSQIGRLRFVSPSSQGPEVPAENLSDLLAHDGAQDLFDRLLQRYAVHSGISGAMPKVLVRSDAPSHFSHKGATHIVKAWTSEHPNLAENEYFCMRAAHHAGLQVPALALSNSGQFLVVERFDLQEQGYLGFEDFCVLSGQTATQKYKGSYESITRRIRDFVSPENVHLALERFFKALALSCALKNGDAHLKNFGVLYQHAESPVHLAPIYDLVTTTVYQPGDILALTLGGTKRWPNAKTLIAFARSHCEMSDARSRIALAEVAHGLQMARQEMAEHMAHTSSFAEMGQMMLKQWDQGMATSLQS